MSLIMSIILFSSLISTSLLMRYFKMRISLRNMAISKCYMNTTNKTLYLLDFEGPSHQIFIIMLHVEN